MTGLVRARAGQTGRQDGRVGMNRNAIHRVVMRGTPTVHRVHVAFAT